ncbi:putative nuclear matrix protein [Diplodia seriata]|uniref:Putative nuclear matrix protein n=1 Tax=Diplodia seriata TaxID=420778 RepID=A0A0G2E4L3_9PEZI|nr:putative nuclear matrix protein [Diplodia seriata]
MAFPAVDSVEAVTRRFKELLEKARKVKASDSIEPQISATDLLDGESLVLSDKIQHQMSHNTVAEISAKNLLHHLVATTTIDDPSFVQVWNLLDVVLACSERNQCDGLLIFYLAEELLDSQSIDGCRRVFDYLESRRERLVAGDFLQNSGASKRIVVLRFCNELLRRLSRAEDAVFCGRVFIFLFQTFPLGDKSSVNSRGEFHVENATAFDEPASSKDEKPDGMEIDPDSNQAVPSITTESVAPDDDTKAEQKKDSRVLFSGDYLAEFKSGIEHTIAKFKDVPKVIPTKKQDKSDEKEGSKNESKPESRTEGKEESVGIDDNRSVKRKHEDAEEEFASPYNPKYLTSRDLFELELSDLAFQRHILVQALVLLDFLLSLTEKSKEKTQKWLYTIPTAESLHKGIQEDELDMEMAMADEDKHRLQEAKASKTWRALRVASKDRLSLFDKIDDGKQLQALFEPEGGDDAGKDERAATETAESKVDGSVAEAASQVQMQEEERAEQQGSQVTAR